jgi:hypothetical protein
VRKSWHKPTVVVFGNVEALTLQGAIPGDNTCPVLGVGTQVTYQGITKYCGFIDAVNHINADVGS